MPTQDKEQTINFELGDKAIALIKEQPLRLSMGQWKQTGVKTHRDLSFDCPVLAPPCGTVGCFAVWSVAAAKGIKNRLSPLDIEDTAMDMLCLTREQADRLFFTERWPSPYKAQWHKLERTITHELNELDDLMYKRYNGIMDKQPKMSDKKIESVMKILTPDETKVADRIRGLQAEMAGVLEQRWNYMKETGK
jgi:hypothetical protein